MRIGLIGSGNIGSTVARLAIGAGHEVVLSNSRGPQTLTDLVAELGERASAGTAAQAAAAGDLVVVSIPFKNYQQVPVDELVGKTVVDSSHVVKAFNTIRSADLASQGQPAGSAGRRALPIAGDDEAAKAAVTALIGQLGFDVVDAGPLREGRRFEPDEPAYLVRLDADGLRDALAKGSAGPD